MASWADDEALSVELPMVVGEHVDAAADLEFSATGFEFTPTLKFEPGKQSLMFAADADAKDSLVLPQYGEVHIINAVTGKVSECKLIIEEGYPFRVAPSVIHLRRQAFKSGDRESGRGYHGQFYLITEKSSSPKAISLSVGSRKLDAEQIKANAGRSAWRFYVDAETLADIQDLESDSKMLEAVIGGTVSGKYQETKCSVFVP